MIVELTKEVEAHQVQPGQLIVGPKNKPLAVSEIRFDCVGVLILGRPPERDDGKRVSYRPSGAVTVIYEDDPLPFLKDLAHALGLVAHDEREKVEVDVDDLGGLLLTLRGGWQLHLEG